VGGVLEYRAESDGSDCTENPLVGSEQTVLDSLESGWATVLKRTATTPDITETDRTLLVLFGTQNRKLDHHLAAMHRILIPFCRPWNPFSP
jgi:hypothetical protein